jgi:hypothetical protein
MKYTFTPAEVRRGCNRPGRNFQRLEALMRASALIGVHALVHGRIGGRHLAATNYFTKRI